MGLGKFFECEVALTFRQQNLAAQYGPLVADCNLYVVTRRPRTYITPGSVPISRCGKLVGKVTIDYPGKRLCQRFRLPFRLAGEGRLVWCDDMPRDYYQIIDDKTGRLILHGDPWGLAFLGSEFSPQLAAHEVIYIGRSVGAKRERNSLDRIIAHDKIQSIYADHSSQCCDIFISVLRISGSSSVFELATPADFSMSRNLPELTGRLFGGDKTIYAEAVSLCEAALIAYFRPEYNTHHKNIFPRKPTKVSDLLTRYRYSNLTVTLDGGGTGIRFWSSGRKLSGFHRADWILPCPDDIPIDEFKASATQMEKSSSKVFSDVNALAHMASVTLAFVPVDMPDRIKKDYRQV